MKTKNPGAYTPGSPGLFFDVELLSNALATNTAPGQVPPGPVFALKYHIRAFRVPNKSRGGAVGELDDLRGRAAAGLQEEG